MCRSLDAWRCAPRTFYHDDLIWSFVGLVLKEISNNLTSVILFFRVRVDRNETPEVACSSNCLVDATCSEEAQHTKHKNDNPVEVLVLLGVEV